MRAMHLWTVHFPMASRFAGAALLTFGSFIASPVWAEDDVVFYGDSGPIAAPAMGNLQLPTPAPTGRRSLGIATGDPRYVPQMMGRSSGSRQVIPAAGYSNIPDSLTKQEVSRAEYARAVSQQIQEKQAKQENSRRGILGRFFPKFSRDTISQDRSADRPPASPAAVPSGVQQAVFRDARNRGVGLGGPVGVRTGEQRQPEGLFGYLNRSQPDTQPVAQNRPQGRQQASKQPVHRPQAVVTQEPKLLRPSASTPSVASKKQPATADGGGVIFVTDNSNRKASGPAGKTALAPPASSVADAKLPRPQMLHDSVRKSRAMATPELPTEPTAQTAGVHRPLIRAIEPAPMVVTVPTTTAPLQVESPQDTPATDEPATDTIVADTIAQPAPEEMDWDQAVAPAPRPARPTYPRASEYPQAKGKRNSSLASDALPANPVPQKMAPEAEGKLSPSPRAVAFLAEANRQAQTARTDEEFTHILRRCRHVMAIDHSSEVTEYSCSLGSWALNKRGELRSDLGQEADAMTDFEDAIRMNSSCWRAIHNRGVLLAQAGNFEKAFEAFNETIELNPDFAKAYSNRASLFIQAGDFTAAMDDYRQAIEIDPDLAIAHKGRGRVCHMLGYMDWAMQHFDAALLLEPGDATIATCRADLLVDRGRYAAASQAYQHAMELDPELPSAPRNLAWLQATCPDSRFVNATEAVANARRALEMLGEEDEVSLDTLAAALAAAGEFQEALATLQRAIELAPSSDVPAYEQRLELYESGQRFVSAPVAAVQQVDYQQPAGL